MSVQVIVSEVMGDLVRQRLQQVAPSVELVIADRAGHLQGDATTATVFFRAGIAGEAYERVLQAAPQLQWVHSVSAGVEGLISPQLRERGITLTNSAGVYGIPIAEWVLHALLSIVKRGPEMYAAQQARRWQDDLDFAELGGKTLMILGAGGIGSEIAKRAAAFDMRVWGANRSGNSVPHFERIVSGDEWRNILPDTDFLVIATPLTDATRNLVAARELALLPRHAWLINIARGAIVDEPALIAALHEKQIAGAALDTFVTEPLPEDSPLWDMPNVIVSPHHSGASPRSTERAIDLFVENLQRFARGEALRNVVDFEAGY